MPRLPLPAMGSQHNAQTRLLLSGVHKELIKSHRVYIKQMQHQVRHKDEHEEYQEAMKHLQSLFPHAEMIMPPYFNTAEVFNKDIDLLQLQVHISAAFKEAFALGMNEYLKGNWQRAKKFLLKADNIMREVLLAFQETPLYKQSSTKKSPGDGPSQTLLKYMEGHRFIAPKDWKGYRPLTSK
ncbi:hypothetical protein EON65_58515 [archaeon]|nr:MAG: hypothetical protein EON65_58515 [archaeon]